jgi:hypothetical protein
MIDAELDDGFTFEVDGNPVRPLLHADPVRKKPCLQYDVAERCFFRKEPTKAMLLRVAEYTVTVENKDFQDLSDSVSLHCLPIRNAYVTALSLLDCRDCQRYAVDHSTGHVVIGPNGKPTPIPGGVKVPCETTRGCLKRHHTDPLGLSNPRWAKTWRHFWTYRNVIDHALKDDPIFLRNKLLLTWIIDYGRDSRFDPFIGRGTGGGSSDDPAEGTAGPACNRAGGSGRSCSTGSCRSGCRTKVPITDDRYDGVTDSPVTNGRSAEPDKHTATADEFTSLASSWNAISRPASLAIFDPDTDRGNGES